MAISTINTTLLYDTGSGTFEKVCDIKSYPDMGSAPSKIDTTDLSQTERMTSILGLQEDSDMTFEANFDATAYALIKGIEADTDFKLEFGDEGVDGEFYWTGKLSVFIMGSGVNEVRKMQITLSAENAISTTDPNA